MSKPEPIYQATPDRELCLVFQGSVPIPDAATGEMFYEELKALLKATSVKTQLNGQIMKRLEPCCYKPKGNTANEKNTSIL